MPRMVRDAKLENRTQRTALEPRKKEYIRLIEAGLHIAYRKTSNDSAGAWCVRTYKGDGKYEIKNLRTAQGTLIVADDFEDANGVTVMSFAQAQSAVRAAAPSAKEAAEAKASDNTTVLQAIEGYRLDLIKRGGAAKNASVLLHHMTDDLGPKVVTKLKRGDFKSWNDGLLASGLKLTSIDRVNKGLKAALNLAVNDRDETTVRPWAFALKQMSTEIVARNVILANDVVLAIVANAYAIDEQFGEFAEVIAQTGTRMSQAARLLVDDLDDSDPAAPKLHMPSSRKGRSGRKASHVAVPISPELARRLRARTIGRNPLDLLLMRADGRAWFGKGWAGPFNDAVKAHNPALIAVGPGRVTMYALRHSAIARELMMHVPAAIVAANHDTSVEKIEKHYARYISNHADHLVRAALLASTAAPMLKEAA